MKSYTKKFTIFSLFFSTIFGIFFHYFASQRERCVMCVELLTLCCLFF